jgi:ParB family transcriptional regulator, chromosome partitioning protein
MPLQLDDLAALDAPTPGSNGQPLMLPLDSIDEDPDQPRQEFDPGALQELADSIGQRGVLQAISVRPHPQQPQRWMVNMGARRLRASRMAGQPVIPAFVDEAADSYDQIIENEQREGLKPLELALFVQKRLAAGDSQAEIAKRMGKSRQYVTLATALIDAPNWLLDVYRTGRCRGITELYELRRLHGEHPQYIEAWSSDRESITRDDLSALRAELSGEVAGSARPGVSALLQAVDAAPATEASDNSAAGAHEAPPKNRQGSRCLHVEMDGQDYQLVVSVVPQKAGHCYVLPLNGGPRLMAAASSLKLLGFVGR